MAAATDGSDHADPTGLPDCLIASDKVPNALFSRLDRLDARA